MQMINIWLTKGAAIIHQYYFLQSGRWHCVDDADHCSQQHAESLIVKTDDNRNSQAFGSIVERKVSASVKNDTLLIIRNINKNP